MRGLVEIKIGGKKRPLKFGTNASIILCEELNLSYQELEGKFSPDQLDKLTLMDLRAFIWAALVAGAKKKKIEIDFNIDDIGDWLDETPAEEFQKAFKANADSLPRAKKGKAA